ncbi:MAG TPA: efflux RND transporter periplasmic adaptor subunit [Terricaulis sp.]|nr:efflux RND transporter periplasmic adaptor subunit [Terricaulis sp.]
MAGLAAACGGGEAAKNTEADRPLVSVVEAAPASAAGAVKASSLIGYRREPQLAFTAPGVIAAISVDSGDVVRRGQRLATLRRTSVGANPNEAALARANAERDLARTQDLFDRGFVSEARLEAARLAVERASDVSIITAPADGVILRRAAEPAQSVAAGAPILVLGEANSGLVARAPVSSAEAARIRIGDAARVSVPSISATPLQARVTRVSAQSDLQTGAFEVEIEISGAAALRSGMVAEVEIEAAAAANVSAALLVPPLALLDARADQGVVFVVDAESIARRRAVRTAGISQAGVLVLEGLAPGERVISAGAAYVRDGEPVRIAAGA